MKEERTLRRQVSIRDDEGVKQDDGAVDGAAGQDASGKAAEKADAANKDAGKGAGKNGQDGKGSSSAEANKADTVDSYTGVPPIDDEEGKESYYKPASIGSNEVELDDLEKMELLIDVEGEFASLPHPDVFNAYPTEVQRKIMEWTDRDVKARRDDESRRQDELMRAKVERDRRKQSIPAIIAALAIVCGAVTGIVTRDPMFSAVFVAIALAVVIGRIATEYRPPNKDSRPKLPK